MTLSDEERAANIDLAFPLLIAEINEKAISRTFLDPAAEPFREILSTTWKELCDQGWTEGCELYGQQRYRLTGKGWVEGLARTGGGRDAKLLDRLGRLSAELKRYVKGRGTDVTVELAKLARDVQLPEGWVFNTVESNAFEILQGRRGVAWKERGLLVRIPITFGMKLLDHMGDIRAQREELREELELAKEELAEYKCSFCGAPIDSQGSVPLSEDVDGYYVSYACGRHEVDGDGQLCPSDPRFPKLEDYELQFIEHPSDPYLKWSCWAKPKTPAAEKVRLLVGRGQTKEEANQQIVDRYEGISKPWIPR